MSTTSFITVGKVKYGLLQAKHDPVNGVFTRDGVSYFTQKGVDRECKIQQKWFIVRKLELDNLMTLLPGTTLSAKTMHLVRTLLPGIYPGYYDVEKDEYVGLGNESPLGVSNIYTSTDQLSKSKYKDVLRRVDGLDAYPCMVGEYC